jgi:pilus assembly protein CpaC
MPAFLMVVSLTLNAAEPFTIGLDSGENVQEFSLPVGKSQIIRSAQPLEQIIVGNPEIADVELLNENQFLLLGKSPGITNVAFKNTDSQIIAVMDVIVGFDIDAIKRSLRELLPEEQDIEVRGANTKVMVSGQVSNSSVVDTVMAVTGSYADSNVVNLLQVGGGHQVLLEARIAEVKRNRLRSLGVQTAIAGSAGSNTVLTALTGAPLTNAFGGGLQINNTGITDSLIINLQALEQEGSAQVLAEPNIVALSGQEASFLVGGEFPVPVVQPGGTAGSITVDYKEFGVGLNFTPTVLSDRRINLRLSTEVSDIDFTSGTTVLGTTVPGLRTRRAVTTIELGDGNSFAIAGLLQNDMSSVVRALPGLGNIPILGALFRSTHFEREETELVIIITAKLVKSTRGNLALPTDNYLPPSSWEQYGLGRIEGEPTLTPRATTSSTQEGLDGSLGHQF